jgi:Tol biopolymer transport system component
MSNSAGTRLGSYEILSPLGSGGMGEVYRARDLRLGREVAIKMLPEDVASDRDRLSRFEQEARAASALNHPNIVTIYEIGSEDGVSYIAMELVEGRTLRELTVSGPLPVKKLLGLGAQIAEGLAGAHSAGIVHRDLKPENVMVSKDGFVKILDFGLAKLADPESGEMSAMLTLTIPETRPGTVLGTVAYMSPEQASGDRLDFRSDQFSLGSILYELSTGQKAFLRNTSAETMTAIIREEPEPVGKLRPDLPPPVRWIVERCLAKDKEERYASTRDLARDLSSVLNRISEASGMEALLPAPARPKRLLWWAVLAAAATLVVGLAAGWLARESRVRPPNVPSFQRLTFRTGLIGNARFAPDGQTVVYSAVWEGESESTLYQTRIGSPESRPFDIANAGISAISRSGELALLLYDSGSTFFWGTLARLPMAGGGLPRRVMDDVPTGGADWSPDGERLVVAHRVAGKFRLESPIGTVLELPRSAMFPRFSPSGDRIAFFENFQSVPARWNWSLSVIDARGGNRKELSSGFPFGSPSWRPDGKEIWVAFSARQESPTALWAVDLSGNRRLVARVPGEGLELFDIFRDGRVLMAQHTVLKSLMSLGPGDSQERDASWLGSSTPADLSPDGTTIVVNERGEGALGTGQGSVIYLGKTDGSPPLRLGEGLAYSLSPDKTLVLARFYSPGKPPKLVLVPTGAGETRTLPTEGLRSFGFGMFSSDGRFIVYSAGNVKGKYRVYAQDLSGGPPRPITPEGVSLFGGNAKPLSPDGRFVIAFRDGQPFLFPVEGGEARAIPGLGPGSRVYVVGWAADGRSLYVVPSGESTIWLHDVESGKRRIWKKLDPPGNHGPTSLRITPDGRYYAYAAWRDFSSLYLVEGLH